MNPASEDTGEWIRLYRAGLGGPAIADACDVPDVLEVLRALTAARRADPALEAEHRSNLLRLAREVEESVVTRKFLTPAWTARLEQLRAFVCAHGRMPRQRGGDDEETALGRWLHAQRGKVSKGTLHPRQRVALDAVGSWESDRRDKREQGRLPERLRAVVEFRARHRRLPTYMNRSDPAERALGIWLHTVRQAHREGRLPGPVAEALDRAVPGWNP